MSLTNCSKCKKVFQRTVHALCPACQQEAMTQVSVICQFLQSNPAQTLEEVASACGISGKELEGLLYSGKLGSAAHKIICHCQGCHKGISATGSKGRFCTDCAMKLASKSTPATNPGVNTAKPGIKRNRPVEADSANGTQVPEPTPQGEPAPVPAAGIAPKNEESASPLGGSYGFTRYSEK
ncbi:MAG: Flagellar operon protein YvyF [Vampirovibrio sp.]|jgi:hypothetical protein|nr:Flagellar operon protein YvyF [Vampirovibrio sp.]